MPGRAPREPAAGPRDVAGTLSPAAAYVQSFTGTWQRVSAGEQRRAAVCDVHFRRACTDALESEQALLLRLRHVLAATAVPERAAAANSALRREITAYLNFTARQAQALGVGRIELFRSMTRNDAGTQICIGPVNEAIEDPASDAQRGDSESLESEANDPIPQLPYADC